MEAKNNIDFTKFHIPVLLKPSLESLGIKENPEGFYIDCTLGLGGHSEAILKEIVKADKGGFLISIDRDENNMALARKRLELIDPEYKFHEIVRSNFSNLKEIKQTHNHGDVKGILFDLGVSSTQYDDPSRGFTYRVDAPLDMRMDLSQELNAKDVVNNSNFETLARAFREYGDESKAGQIASAIIKYREQVGEIKTTQELESVVIKALGPKVSKTRKHPAAKVFQAIRVLVNDEYNEEKNAVEAALDILSKNGRLVIITFNSGEDRLIKSILKKATEVEGDRLNDFTLPSEQKQADFYQMYRKPVVATEEELKENDRARSAKLRAVVRK